MNPLRKTVFLLFFLSGFCGLLYQVIWMRLAFSHFGIITPVMSVVVSVFMLGLSLGSWWGGRWVAKTTPTRSYSAINAYAAIEGIIGLGAFIVPLLMPLGDTLLLPSGDMNSASYLIYSALILTLSLVPWCILMGATFPLMMAFLKERESEKNHSSFSFLYVANVIGAMFGTILTADVLVELLGFKKTLLVAGCTNFAITGISLWLSQRYPYKVKKATRTKEKVAVTASTPTLSAKEVLWYYTVLFVTGFTSMSLEVIWVRNFTPVVGTTVYSFALIVAVYLLATWMGSYLYRKHLAKNKARSTAGLLAALAISSLFIITINDPRLHLFKVGVILGIFPFSFLLGYLTPSLIDRYAQGDPDHAGRAYAVNIVGCILGPLLASYVFLPLLGAKNSMVLMALPYVVFMVLQWPRLAPRLRVLAGATTIVLLVAAVGYNRSYEERYVDCIIRRDSTATVISMGEGMHRRLLVNGVGITELTSITKIMAHMPLAALIERPRSALVICFGMGTTYRSLLSWKGLKVTAVELVPSVKDAFGYYHEDANTVLNNPDGKIVIDDGRRFLRRTGETFDLITLDPPPPIEAAGSSLLYAQEFYDLAKKRLSTGGIVQQWFPGGPGIECQAIARSLTRSFPHVRAFASIHGWGVHFFASREPIQIPRAAQLVARMPPAARADLIEWFPKNTTPKSVIDTMLARELSVEQLMAGTDVAITDDRPINEYYMLRRAWAHHKRRWAKSS